MPKANRRKRSLSGGVMRVYPDHRSLDAKRYRRAYTALQARFPGLGPGATTWLREATLLSLELERLAAESRGLCGRRAQAAGRHAMSLRNQLMDIEARLAAMVPAPRKRTIAEVFTTKDGSPGETESSATPASEAL